jgi:acetyltransferase
VLTNQGFAEADSRGRELQKRMLAEAAKFGIRILGPNTLGVLNAFHRFTSSFMPHDREEVPIGLICQSGIFYVGVTQLIGGMGIAVDVGNGCDVDIVDALEWLGSDERLRVIALHAEEVRGGNRFLDVAGNVSRRIPVVTLKTGRSYEGAKAAASHSGSMAGEDRIVGAAFKKSGLIRVDETQDQVDLVRAFVRLPPMKGPRVAVVTLSGAGGIIFLDALERRGLQPARFSQGTIDAIQSLSPDWMRLSNPIDIWPAVMKKGMRKAFSTALRDSLADPNVDGVLCIALALGDAEQAHLGAEEVIREVSEEFDKPVVVWFYGSHYEVPVKKFSGDGRALTVASLERGVRVLAAMANYEKWKTHRE